MTMKCEKCEEMGYPQEGMTGMCEFCGGIYCFGHLNINRHNCKIRTVTPGKVERATSLLNSELLEVSRLLLAELKQTIDDIGGCDHTANVCCCEQIRLADRAESVISKLDLLEEI